MNSHEHHLSEAQEGFLTGVAVTYAYNRSPVARLLVHGFLLFVLWVVVAGFITALWPAATVPVLVGTTVTLVTWWRDRR